MTTRREFVAGMGAALLSPGARRWKASEVRLGYASITWNGNDLQAIDDIASLGFRGIQLRSNVLTQFGERPAALKELLKSRGLTLVALSSGAVTLDAASEASMIEQHVRNARFVRDVGGKFLQVTDERPRGRASTSADIERLGQLLTTIGKKTADVGVPLGYHNHMGSLGEKPEDVDRILGASDAQFVKFELDIAHYQQGGGDPARAIRQHAARLLFLHIKDVESPVPGDTTSSRASYRFVELGRGRVDLPAVFAALDVVKFRGWAVVELDSVPDKSRTPKESAQISQAYLLRTLHRTAQ